MDWLNHGGQVLAILGAVIAVVMAGTGSAKGVGLAGEQLAGVVSESPDVFGRALVLQFLPGMQGIYGFLIGFLVLIKLNVFGGMPVVPVESGLLLLLGCLPVAVVGCFSAIYQGRAAAASIALLGRRADAGGQGLSIAMMVETFAVLALLASFLMVWFVQI